MTDDVYITVSSEADNDQPVADILFRQVHWASLRFEDGEGVLTVYSTPSGFDLPVAIALSSIDEAERRLR
jgi:hypothetical protein